jgi:protein TonB
VTTAAVVSYRIYDLPWTTSAEQEQRFRRHLMIFVGVSLLVALILSFLPLPQRDPTEIEEIPERYARLLIEQVAPPPPPPPPVVQEEEPEPEPLEPEPVVEEIVEPDPIIPEPEPPPEPVDVVAEARARASVAGLLPFAEELASLRDAELSETLESTDLAGTVAEEAPVNERSLIASNVGASSGGINTSNLSRNTGGSGIGTRTTTVVESPVEGFGPAGGAVTRTSPSDLASRSREEIERVFDRNKGAIYALYNRALRVNPTLQGKVVLRLTITPQGTVSFCEIVSSELNDPDLEQRLVQRILLFQFEAKDVETITTTKPIDFFPA